MNNIINTLHFKNKSFYFLYKESKPDVGGLNSVKHQHSFYEIMYIEEGQIEYVIENRHYIMEEGDVLFIKPGLLHLARTCITTPSVRYCIGFYPNEIESASLAEEIFARGEHFKVGNKSLFADLARAYRRKLEISKEKADLFCKSILNMMMIVLNDVNLTQEKLPVANNRNLQTILEYISKNLTEIRSSDDISSALFFSKSYLRSIFKNEMKIGIMEYVRNKKILLAHNKIRNGAKPTEIYAECGFSNYPSFYRAYVAYFSYSPREAKPMSKRKGC